MRSFAQVIGGDVEDRIAHRRRTETGLRKFIRNQELDAFPAVVVEESLMDGAKSLLQSHAIGGLRPNALLLAWREEPEEPKEFGRMLRLSRALDRSVIAVRCDSRAERWSVPDGTIDVWWPTRGNGALMLVFALLLSQTPLWRKRPIRLLHAVQSPVERERAAPMLTELLEAARMRVAREIIVSQDVGLALRTASEGAAVVFRGCNPPEDGTEEAWHRETSERMAGLGDVILVSSAGDVRLEA